MDKEQENIWDQLHKELIKREKNKEIGSFLLELANPKNWACGACGDDVYRCNGDPHEYDTWMGNDPLPIDKARELLLKLGDNYVL